MRHTPSFLRNKRFRSRTDAVHMNAAAVQHQCAGYVRQMALPLIPERRIKGALSVVSRDTGLTYSKVRKIYYGLTDHILAFEWRSIVAAYQRHVIQQERRLEAELQTLRALRDERRMWEAQNELDLATPRRAVEAAQDQGGDD